MLTAGEGPSNSANVSSFPVTELPAGLAQRDLEKGLLQAIAGNLPVADIRMQFEQLCPADPLQRALPNDYAAKLFAAFYPPGAGHDEARTRLYLDMLARYFDGLANCWNYDPIAKELGELEAKARAKGDVLIVNYLQQRGKWPTPDVGAQPPLQSAFADKSRKIFWTIPGTDLTACYTLKPAILDCSDQEIDNSLRKIPRGSRLDLTKLEFNDQIRDLKIAADACGEIEINAHFHARPHFRHKVAFYAAPG